VPDQACGRVVGKEEITVWYIRRVGRWFFLRCRGFDVFGAVEQQQSPNRGVFHPKP
jgi:hypothetical protein